MSIQNPLFPKKIMLPIDVDRIENSDRIENKDNLKKSDQFKTSHALFEKAQYYLNKEKIKKREISPFYLPFQCETQIKVMENFLSRNQGFCIGESHDDKAPKHTLIENMEFLKKQGVAVLFMEQFYEDLQPDLDDYARTGMISSNLKKRMDKSKYQYGYLEILEAARQAGIRVVGIDHRLANIIDDDARTISMNYIAYKIMKKEISQLGDKKYVVLAGVAHTSHKNIPALSKLLNCPSWIIRDVECPLFYDSSTFTYPFELVNNAIELICKSGYEANAFSMENKNVIHII